MSSVTYYHTSVDRIIFFTTKVGAIIIKVSWDYALLKLQTIIYDSRQTASMMRVNF